MKTNRLFGSILLITGSCIGVGMLGLPVNTALAGFGPSTALFALCWLFMMVTGLLLLETNLYFKNDANIITMAGRTVGPLGQAVGWIFFLFLFYSLMIAFTSGCGELFADFAEEASGLLLPGWVGSVLFVSFFGLIVYMGTCFVDRFNRLFMFGLAVSYLLLVVMGGGHVRGDLLRHTDWEEAFWAVPVMIISFGYHNLVPSLTTYLEGDRKRLCLAILIGSFAPLLIYLVWEGLILGLVPAEAFHGALKEGHMVTRTLKETVGSAWVVDVAQYFAFFAIVTTFLGVALSFVDFLADGLSIRKTAGGKAAVVLLALGPPLFLALLYPKIFLTALKYAGGFGAVTLFGILPVLMVWSGRYGKRLWKERIVPGEKGTLVLVMAMALAIFALQFTNVLYFNK